MTLAPGRYVFTLRVTHNLLGLGVPAGTRIVANVTMRDSGRHQYRIREIAPNPEGYALEMGYFAEPDWSDGIATVIREVLGHKVEIMVEAVHDGKMTVRVASADTEITMFEAAGKWRRDKNQANLEPTVPDIRPQIPTIRWQDRLNRQCLFMGAPQYQWALMSRDETNAALDAIQAAGLDGPSIEFGGTFIRDEYNKVPNREDIADIYDAQISAWAWWSVAIRARGLVAHIAFLNANQSKANRMSDQLWEAKARTFIRTYGPDNMLVLPLSETDKRTRTSIGNAIAKGLLAGGLPKSQIISMAGKWGDWNETHHGRGKVPSGGHRTINANDNGPSIRDLYGDDWQRGGTPNVARIQEYAAEIRRKGVSGVIYSFGVKFDHVGLAAAARGWGVVSAPVVPHSESKLTGRYIGGSHEDIGWAPAVDRPKSKYGREQINGKWCTGRLWGAPVGKPLRAIEWIKEGFQTAHVINAFARKNDKDYNQGLQGGETMVFQIRSTTNRVVDPTTFTVRMARS